MCLTRSENRIRSRRIAADEVIDMVKTYLR